MSSVNCVEAVPPFSLKTPKRQFEVHDQKSGFPLNHFYPSGSKNRAQRRAIRPQPQTDDVFTILETAGNSLSFLSASRLNINSLLLRGRMGTESRAARVRRTCLADQSAAGAALTLIWASQHVTLAPSGSPHRAALRQGCNHSSAVWRKCKADSWAHRRWWCWKPHSAFSY